LNFEASNKRILICKLLLVESTIVEGALVIVNMFGAVGGAAAALNTHEANLPGARVKEALGRHWHDWGYEGCRLDLHSHCSSAVRRSKGRTIRGAVRRCRERRNHKRVNGWNGLQYRRGRGFNTPAALNYTTTVTIVGER
jgi:hypothetical protein